MHKTMKKCLALLLTLAMFTTVIADNGFMSYAAAKQNEYTEYTFSDVGIDDGEYKTSAIKSLEIDTLNSVSFVGMVQFSEGAAQPGIGFIRNAGDWNGLKFIIANGNSLYIQDFITHKDFSFGYEELGMESAEELTAYPMKIRSSFKIEGDELKMTVTVNDLYEKSQTFEADKFSDVKSMLVYGTDTLPIQIQSVKEENESNEPTIVSFRDFGMYANKVLGTSVVSEKTPNDSGTLDKIEFSGYISFEAQGESDCFSYGVNDQNKGIDFFWAGDNIWVWDQTGGFNNASGNGCFFGKGLSELGLTNTTDEVKVTITTIYKTTGVSITITVGKYTETFEVEGYDNYLGTGIRVKSTSGTISYRSTLGDTFDARDILEEKGYKRLSANDFGLEYKTYENVDGNTVSSGIYKDADNIDMKYLDVDMKYSDFSSISYIAYGGWTGIQIQYVPAESCFVVNYVNVKKKPNEFGMSEYTDKFNLKIATKLDSTENNYAVNIWVNDIQISKDQSIPKEEMGNEIVIYTAETAKIQIIAPQITTINKEKIAYNLRDYDQIAVKNYFVPGDIVIEKEGEEIEVTDNQLTTPGDYKITTDASNVARRYIQDVSLYIIGDVDLDGIPGTSEDVKKLEEILKSVPYEPEKASEYAADIDNNGKVDSKDLELIKEANGDIEKLRSIIKKYYVPSKSYEYIGGNDVMPVAGFFGPYTSSEKNYITDDVYKLIKDSGINIINYSANDASDELSLVKNNLALAEKYGIGLFVNDKTLTENLTNDELSKKLEKYALYESFLGIHIVDEPSYSKADDNPRPLENYTGLSKKLNAFSNITGFINMVAEDATTVNKYWFGNRIKDYYNEYWEQYMKDASSQVISSDDYPFNNGLKEDATDANGYFRTLGTTRSQSLKNNVPFWSYVQAGGNYDNDTDETNADLVANEAETYWNVNTALAFGAKGIVWFPTIQPTYFDGTDSDNSIDRNGIILSNGKKSKRYEWVVNVNKQIAAVDDVLMKSTSTAIVASGGYAKENATGNVTKNLISSGTNTTEIKDGYGKLSKVASTSSDYGALVGCFSYRDTEAFYVVNYDVTKQATVILTLDNNYHVRVVQNGESMCGTMKNNLVTLKLDAGQGALVVLENNDDKQCYYKKATTDNGDVYQCIHTEGNSGESNYETAILFGDLNVDDNVDVRDLVCIKKVIQIGTKTTYEGMADINSDYILNDLDSSLFRKYIAK